MAYIHRSKVKKRKLAFAQLWNIAKINGLKCFGHFILGSYSVAVFKTTPFGKDCSKFAQDTPRNMLADAVMTSLLLNVHNFFSKKVRDWNDNRNLFKIEIY